MKHETLRWNPGTREWFCIACGLTSHHVSEQDAHVELDQYECSVPAAEAPRAAPGTETMRLIKKAYKMTLRIERSGSRFAMATDEGRPFIQLELFHDTAASLNALSLGFEVLSGVTLEQARSLVHAMNERIVGVIVTPK